MKRFVQFQRPSPAIVIACLALIVAMSGTAVAVVGLNGAQKKQVKKIATRIANKQIAKQAPDWALVSATGTILAQSGGISVVGHTTGRTGLRFPAGTDTHNGAIVSQVTAFGFAGTGGGLFFTKVGPCPTTGDCSTVGGTANTDAVVDTFAPNSTFADAGVYVTFTR